MRIEDNDEGARAGGSREGGESSTGGDWGRYCR